MSSLPPGTPTPNVSPLLNQPVEQPKTAQSPTSTTSEKEISPLEAQAKLKEIMTKGQQNPGSLTMDEIREGVHLVQILRRTQTGPAKAKTARRGKVSVDDIF